jgi:hypothetical protein
MAKVALLGTILVAGMLAACGGSAGPDDAGGGGESGLSKAEYIEQGDDVCRRLDEAGQSVVVPPQEAPLPAHARFLEDVLAEVVPARDEFVALDAPDGDEAAKERFDAYWNGVVSHLEDALAAAEADDRAEYDRLLGELEADEALAEDLKDYGFEVCGNT